MGEKQKENSLLKRQILFMRIFGLYILFFFSRQVEVLEKMAGCLTPTSDYKLEDDQ
jgi:hypothetical protein